MEKELRIRVTPSLIAESFMDDELIEFLVEIDRSRRSWDFTVKLVNAFIKELEKDESRDFIAEELGFENA